MHIYNFDMDGAESSTNVHPVQSRQNLVQEIEHGAEKEYIFFWGHKGTPDRIDQTCFSQWYPSTFVVDGDTYVTAEQFMMAEKARLFGDADVRRQIMEADTPRQAKGLGRRVRGFKDEVWRLHKTDIVVAGNIAKFKQNGDMLDVLLSTGTSVLVEASPTDRIWGIGMRENHPHARRPDKWHGQNLLGFSLMRVRDVIVNERSGTVDR